MLELKDLKGAFSLINILENDDEIDNIICEAMESNLDIDDLDINECLLESCYY